MMHGQQNVQKKSTEAIYKAFETEIRGLVYLHSYFWLLIHHHTTVLYVCGSRDGNKISLKALNFDFFVYIFVICKH